MKAIKNLWLRPSNIFSELICGGIVGVPVLLFLNADYHRPSSFVAVLLVIVLVHYIWELIKIIPPGMDISPMASVMAPFIVSAIFMVSVGIITFVTSGVILLRFSEASYNTAFSKVPKYIFISEEIGLLIGVGLKLLQLFIYGINKVIIMIKHT